MLLDTHTNLMWYPEHLSDEFVQYASEKGLRRFGTISSARGRPLSEIDVDYTPLHLEDAFADEDERALASA